MCAHKHVCLCALCASGRVLCSGPQAELWERQGSGPGDPAAGTSGQRWAVQDGHGPGTPGGHPQPSPGTGPGHSSHWAHGPRTPWGQPAPSPGAPVAGCAAHPSGVPHAEGLDQHPRCALGFVSLPPSPPSVLRACSLDFIFEEYLKTQNPDSQLLLDSTDLSDRSGSSRTLV